MQKATPSMEFEGRKSLKLRENSAVSVDETVHPPANTINRRQTASAVERNQEMGPTWICAHMVMELPRLALDFGTPQSLVSCPSQPTLDRNKGVPDV